MGFTFWKKKEKRGFQETMLKCPRCKKDMEKIRKHSVVIDHCKKCHGIWLDDKEIEKMVDLGKGNKKTRKEESLNK